MTLGGYPGELRALLGIWVEETDALLPGTANRVVMEGGATGFEAAYGCDLLCDVIHAETAEVVAAYGDDFYAGTPVVTRHRYGEIPKDLSIPDLMRRRLATKEGKRLYLQRQASVEPVFGATEGARGLRQFLHRGTEKNHHLFRFDMAVHNVLKILGQAQRRLTQPPSTPSTRQRSKPAATFLTAAAA